MSYTNTKHKEVFVYHKHKISFEIAPVSTLRKYVNKRLGGNSELHHDGAVCWVEWHGY
jgi:hypothetical protein